MFKHVLASLIISIIISCNSAFAATFNTPLTNDFYADGRAFLLFDVSDLVVSTDDVVTAVLKLYHVSQPNYYYKLHDYNIGVYQVDSNLSSEMDTDTLNNLSLNSSDLIGTLQGTLTDDSEWLSVTITLSNEEWLNLINNGGTLAIVLSKETSLSRFPNIYSSDVIDDYTPSLTVTTTSTSIPTPEPSSLILILTGSIGLVTKIRKKVFIV